ncbi:MAG: aminoglycoside phosphotransferase family protein [Planctomycetota bacterium]|jgi:hypothetical protein|nr:aminoglycoside phosphotransferase family protein [Planctomycetota bacterium]MDP6940746.1 aminoglycoside phosphotransferase family protein [Planctomycetota bacterium]
MLPTPELQTVAQSFLVDGDLVGADIWTGGHINDSFLLEFHCPDGRKRFLLQKVNGGVFPEPSKVMENVQRVTEFVSVRAPGLAFLHLIPTKQNEAWLETPEGDCWRLYPFMGETTALLEVENERQAHAAAFAFGHFARLLADLPNPPLHEVLPGFHDTLARIRTLEAIATKADSQLLLEVEDDLSYILEHKDVAGTLMAHLESGDLPQRVVHNDAKISNVLLDSKTGEAVCVVDLDTVMPGTSLFDYGDMLRSMCSFAKEDEQALEQVQVNSSLCSAIHRGYLEGVGSMFTEKEKELMPISGFIIALELGVRFLTDHLNGNRYFNINRPGQNLDRARVQLKLAKGLKALAGS